MDDIHTPSVVSSRPSNGLTNGGPAHASSLQELSAEKERIEAELSALSSVLDSHGVNMNTSLTTFDGFPRADIDVAQIRTTRTRIIVLRNDYKALLARIEVAVQAQFANMASRSGGAASDGNASTSSSSQPSTSENETPFAKVNSVTPGSPADAAGLKTGDKVVRFGTANWLNHENLRKVSEVVSQNEGRTITVTVLREGTEKTHLLLTPKRDWGGRGILGCHLLPM